MSLISSVPFWLSSARGYTINQSLRFRASNSARLSRTGLTAGTANRWAVSFWAKLGSGSNQGLFCGYSNGNNYTYFGTSASNQLVFTNANAGVIDVQFTTTAVYRDPTAWYHVAVFVDTTLATASDRYQIWVNGTRVTSFATSTNTLAQNSGLYWNDNFTQYIGTFDTVTNYLDGYIAEFINTGRVATNPTVGSFGQTDPATGAWVPRRYTGTYGTNGFYLPFNDAASTTTISQDRSGNGNNWTSSGISVTAGVSFDQMLDSPTNNYATWSSIDRDSNVSVFEANLRVDSASSAASHRMIRGTQFVSSGKFYFEITSGAGTAASGNVNILGMDGGGSVTTNVGSGSVQGFGFGYATDAGSYYASGWTSSGSPPVMANATYGIAVDLDTGRAWIRNAGGWFQGDPATNTSPTFTRTGAVVPLAPAWSYFSAPNPTTVYLNCGQRAFAYTPPTGFVALNTVNLSAPTIRNGATAFQATLRTGTGASASVSSLAFQPDLVWVKSRSNATNHNLFDSVRGVHQGLESNTTAVEYADSTTLTAFNSNGYSLGIDGGSRGVNINTNTYVDWAWREGAAYGFDIVTYTGDGVNNRTVAHGLNAVPHFGVVKSRANAGLTEWATFHRNLTASNMVFLNLTSGQIAVSSSTNGGVSAVSSTNITLTQGASSIANVNGNTGTYVAYLWTSIPGFSLFGSYTGNGSADGPFVWCGFRPRWLMVKRADAGAESWNLVDAARDPSNVITNGLVANTAGAEGTGYNIDFTANGFKVRLASGSYNTSGGTYIFAAFAETPFKSANAR